MKFLGFFTYKIGKLIKFSLIYVKKTKNKRIRNIKFRIVITWGWGSPLVDLIFSNVLVLGLDGRFKDFHF